MNRRNGLIFLFFLVAAFFAYRNCYGIFIPADNYGQLYYLGLNYSDAWHKYLEHGAPYLTAFPLLYLLFHLLGTSAASWVTLSIIMHALNAFLVYLTAFSLAKNFTSIRPALVGFFSGLLFLISPYQTEDVLWVTVNFRWLLHALVTLAGIYLFISHLTAPSLKKIIFIQGLFLLGLFSNELTFILPGIYFILFFLFKAKNKTSSSLRNLLAGFMLPQAASIGLYFIISKILSGYWLWHDGDASSFMQTSAFATTFLKYILKFFLLYRYLPLASLDEWLRGISANGFVVLALIVVLAGAGIFFVSRLKKNKSSSGYLWLALMLCFSVSLLPVLPLDSSFLHYIYPDRYGYLPSVFFYIFLVTASFSLLKKFFVPFLCGYAFLSWVLLSQTISAWNSTNEHCNRLIKNYKPFLNYEKVFILDAPAYYNGIAAFRSAIEERIFFEFGNPVEKVNMVAGSYRDVPSDSIVSAKISGNSVKVIGRAKKTPYFSTKGGWAKSYETDELKVEFGSSGCAYELTFKREIPANSAFIFASGDGWKKAD